MMLVVSLLISGSYDKIAGSAPGSQVNDKIQGAPIARRMQEMAAGGDSDCMKMAQDVETCPTGLKCMFDQSVPDCELDYSAFDNVKTCQEYFVAVSELDSVVLECYQAIAQDMFADIDIGGMTGGPGSGSGVGGEWIMPTPPPTSDGGMIGVGWGSGSGMIGVGWGSGSGSGMSQAQCDAAYSSIAAAATSDSACKQAAGMMPSMAAQIIPPDCDPDMSVFSTVNNCNELKAAWDALCVEAAVCAGGGLGSGSGVGGEWIMPTPPQTSDGGMIGVGSGSGSGSGDRLNNCACEDGSVPGSGGCAPSAENPIIWCCEGGSYLSYLGPDACPGGSGQAGSAPTGSTSGSGSGSGSGDGDMDSTRCAPGCRPNWPGDGVCDPDCAVEACGFDLGDCDRSVPTAEEPRAATVECGADGATQKLYATSDCSGEPIERYSHLSSEGGWGECQNPTDGYSIKGVSCADGVIVEHWFTTNDCTGTFEVQTMQFPSTSGECFDLYEAQCYYMANIFESDYDDSVCLMAAQDPVELSAIFGACTELLDYSAFETVQTCEDFATAYRSVCPQLRSCAPEMIGAPTGSGSGSGSGDGDMDSTQCAPGCPPNWLGDGVCDSGSPCDVEECGFDLGDCDRSVPTAEDCTACTACAPCQACFTDPAACAPGTDLFQTCAGDCAPAATAGPYADLCASEKCIVTCAGDACAGCDTDPTKCYPAMGGQPAGEKYESCVAAGCTDCQACEVCLGDPTLCAPESPGGPLGYCSQCLVELHDSPFAHDDTRPDPGPAKKCKKAKKGYNWGTALEECAVGDVRPCACTLPTAWPAPSPDAGGPGICLHEDASIVENSMPAPRDASIVPSRDASIVPSRMTLFATMPKGSPSPEWWSDAGLEQQFASSGQTTCCCDACEEIGACSHEEVKKKKVKKCKKQLKKVGQKCKECVTAEVVPNPSPGFGSGLPIPSGALGVDVSKGDCKKAVKKMKKSCDCK